MTQGRRGEHNTFCDACQFSKHRRLHDEHDKYVVLADKNLHMYTMLIKTERYTLTDGATVTEIFVAIFGACVVTLGPVYRQLRYGDPQGSSSKFRKSRDGEDIWPKENRSLGRITIRTRESFEPLGALDEGSETTITGSGHRTVTPMRGAIVDDGFD